MTKSPQGRLLALGEAADVEVAPRNEPRGGRVAAAVLLLFAVLSLPLTRVGKPESPAYAALEKHGLPVVAIVGNSRPHTGISPRELRRAWEAAGFAAPRVHNFAVDGTDALHHASFLEFGLLAGEQTPAVVVWPVDALMFDASRTGNHLEQLRPADLPTLLAAGAPEEVTLDVLTMAVFPAYRHRPLLREKVEDKTEEAGKRLVGLQPKLLGLEPEPFHPKPREYVDGGDGHVPFRIVADWAYRFYERNGPHYAGQFARFEPSAWHVEVARHALRKAKARGVVVVLVEMPVAPYFRERWKPLETHRRWDEAIAALARDEGVPLLSHAALYDADERFGDPGHMPEPTALEYSQHLARELTRLPGVAAVLTKGR